MARTPKPFFLSASTLPRFSASYDKRRGRLLVRAAKFHPFGDACFRMTRERCEEFFDDDENFGPACAAQQGLAAH